MNSYTHALSTDQATKLRILLKDLGFIFSAETVHAFLCPEKQTKRRCLREGTESVAAGQRRRRVRAV